MMDFILNNIVYIISLAVFLLVVYLPNILYILFAKEKGKVGGCKLSTNFPFLWTNKQGIYWLPSCSMFLRIVWHQGHEYVDLNTTIDKLQHEINHSQSATLWGWLTGKDEISAELAEQQPNDSYMTDLKKYCDANGLRYLPYEK